MIRAINGIQQVEGLVDDSSFWEVSNVGQFSFKTFPGPGDEMSMFCIARDGTKWVVVDFGNDGITVVPIEGNVQRMREMTKSHIDQYDSNVYWR